MAAKASTYQTPRGMFHVRDTENGVPLVFIHGWPQSSMCWEPIVPLLNPAFRVIRPDLRGLGDSERTLGDLKLYTKQSLAADVVALLDAMGIDSFGLCGHDWGGIVAQEVALAIPERVKALCLLNIAVINNAKGNLKVREKLRQSGQQVLWYQSFMQQPDLPEALIVGREEAWLRHFLRMAHQKKFPESTVQEYVRTFQIPGTVTTSCNMYRAMYYDIKRWEEVMLSGQKFSMPGLYIYGNRDIVILPEYTHHFEECFAENRGQVVEVSAGHFVVEEAPEECAREINQFFEPILL
ncbi:MAG TPA: alpha/beta hydrolase [Microscillaceae bacterium]|jgi:pimeloyl-ACP methyl ester carboxylesterase|nr:alpha/beta hydrolase [Microscillaceae bacterium]